MRPFTRKTVAFKVRSCAVAAVAAISSVTACTPEPLDTVESGEAALADVPPPANADGSQKYVDDWNRLKKILGYATDAFSYVNSATAAIAWLTGVNNPAPGPTLDDIRGIVVDSLREVQATELISQVDSIASDMRDLKIYTVAHATELMSRGESPEAMMSDAQTKQYMINFLSQINSKANDAIVGMSRTLQTASDSSPHNHSHEKAVAALLPAYLTLVPLKASATKMVSELVPGLKGGEKQILAELYQTAGLTLYKAVGTYSISFLEGNGAPGSGAPRLFSPVGQDVTVMFKRPLYSLYHRVANSNLNTYPALRFSQYQQSPLVNAALTMLQRLNWQLHPDPVRAAQLAQEPPRARRGGRLLVHPPGINVSEDRVWIPSPWTDPNHMRTRPSFQDVMVGRIDRIWACDYFDQRCPRLEDQPN